MTHISNFMPKHNIFTKKQHIHYENRLKIQEVRKMKYKEEMGDLFELDNNVWKFAQCISADFAMKAGIAVLFNRKYQIKETLKDAYGDFLSKWDEHEQYKGWCLYRNNVFNMITKRRHWDLPELEHIQNALNRMRVLCLRDKVEHLAMPKIACGIDGQDWNVISKMIQDTFKDVDIEILIRYI